jgi:hypothetical protein
VVSDIVQTLPLLSNAVSNSSPQGENGTTSPSASAVVTRDSRPIPVDTISISYQSRLTVADVKKEDAKKEEANKVNNSGNPVRTMAKMQFVYDLNGDLSVRYMDTANRLIYQVPSELMIRLKEAASKADSSVDTKA